MRYIEIRFHPRIFVLHGLHNRAGFVDLFAQCEGVFAELTVGRVQLNLLLFQKALSRKAGAAFFCQLVGQGHT